MNRMNLHWCETFDHTEDWFIVASSAKEACRIFEDTGGYETGDAWASLACRIPQHTASQPDWPSHELISAIGGVFLSEDTPRVVQIGETVYEEGGLDAVINRLSDDQSEAVGQGRTTERGEFYPVLCGRSASSKLRPQSRVDPRPWTKPRRAARP